jgi:hypothetical protein
VRCLLSRCVVFRTRCVRMLGLSLIICVSPMHAFSPLACIANVLAAKTALTTTNPADLATTMNANLATPVGR